MAVRLRPEGATAPSPGQATVGSDTLGRPDTRTMRPEEAKAATEVLSCHCFCPFGAHRLRVCPTQGAARCARLPWAGSLHPLPGFVGAPRTPEFGLCWELATFRASALRTSHARTCLVACGAWEVCFYKLFSLSASWSSYCSCRRTSSFISFCVTFSVPFLP